MSTFSFEEVSLSIDKISAGFQIRVKAKLYGNIVKEPHIGYVVGVIMLDDDSGEVPNKDNTFYGPTLVLSSRQLQTDAKGNFLAVNFDFNQSALRMDADPQPNNPDEWKARVYLAGTTPMENLANKESNTVVITA